MEKFTQKQIAAITTVDPELAKKIEELFSSNEAQAKEIEGLKKAAEKATATITDLQKQLKDVTTLSTEAANTVKEQAAKIDSLEKENEELNAENAKLEEENGALINDKGDLEEKLASCNCDGTSAKSAGSQNSKLPGAVEFEGKKYLFTIPSFHLPSQVGVRVTAEQASTDPDLIAEILAIKGQMILKEQL